MAQTKKNKKAIMTIPQLRKAFDHIENYTAGLLQKEKDAKKRRQAFQEEWMKVFHHAVDEKAADAYLQFEAKKGKSNKTRRMRGGGPLGGAPLDYSTRPGIYGVYGTFPEYISGGFATMGDATNTMAIQARCNSPEQAAAFPPPYTGFGAASLAQKGGKRKSRRGKGRKTRKMRGGAPTWGEFASAASFRPLTSSVPPSMAYAGVMEWKGSEPYPSSLANTGSPAYRSMPAIVQAPTAGAITRDLASEL